MTFPSSTLIALDTAADICSVALAHDGEIVESSAQVGHRHSEHVLPMLGALLEAHGLSLADCNAIAFGAGPGAFTGLRIACGVAQGLAYGAHKRVLPVGSLEALAESARAMRPGARRILGAVDARMNEAYWAVYDIEDGSPRERAAPALAAAGELARLIDRWQPDVIAGNAFAVFASALQMLDDDRLLPAARASAATVAAIALRDWRDGKAIDPAQAAPVYVRDRVAQTIEERRALRAEAAL